MGKTTKASRLIYNRLVNDVRLGARVNLPEKMQVFDDFLTAKESEVVTFAEEIVVDAEDATLFLRKIHVSGHIILFSYNRCSKAARARYKNGVAKKTAQEAAVKAKGM